MELATDLAQVVKDVVLKPDFTSALAIFTISLTNELLAVLPYNVILSGQLLFLEGPLSTAVLARLLLFVAVPIGLGTVLGSLPVYGLAYFGGKPAINRFSKYLRFSWEHVERIESKFKGSWYDEISFLALRSIPILPALPINVAAGILRMRPAPYLILTLAGTIIKMMIMLAFVGFGAIGIESLAR